MSDLARLLQQYGYGQPNPLAQDGESYDTSNVLAGMPKPNALANALRVAGAPPQDEHGFLFSNVGGELKFNPYEAIKNFMSYRAPPGALSTSGDDTPVRNSVEAAGWLGLSGLGLNAAGQVPANALGAVGARLRGYHWTPKAGEISEANRFAPLSHFGSTPEQANERYTKQVLAEATPEWKAKNSDHGAVLPVDIEMQNPLRIHDHYRHDPEVVAALIDWAEKYGSDTTRRMNLTTYQGPVRTAVLGAKSPEEAAAIISKALDKRGYDGLVYKNNYEAPGDSYIVTRPETVRSATTGKTLYSHPYGLPSPHEDR